MAVPGPSDATSAFPPIPAGSVLPYLTTTTLPLAAKAIRTTGGVVLGMGRRRLTVPDGPVLVDPATYLDKDFAVTAEARPLSGGGRRRTGTPGAWAGSSLFATGALVERDDEEHLRRLLHVEEDGAPVLALPYQWFRDGRLDVLVEQVREVGRPVAVVLSDTFNVLDKARTVAGLVELIQRVRPVPLAVLRCDVSAVGAVAFGAALGAVGTTTTSRHRPAGGGPPPDPARPRDDSPRLFVPQLLDYFKASQLTELVVDRDDEAMTCLCEGCDGQSLFRFAESSRHPPLTVERHNLYATEEVAWNIVKLPPRDRAATWLRACRTAAERLRELRRVRGAVVPDVGRWLQQWCDLPYDRPNWSTASPP